MAKKNKEVIKNDDIYIKYEKYVKSINSDYLIGIQYDEIMEILRYVEKRMNIQYPIDLGCSNCIYRLVKLFASLKK